MLSYRSKKFLEIEKLRYDKRLKVEYNIDKKAAMINIPPMLIQPLVENAVRYGENNEGNIFIKIEAKKEKSNIIIIISDQGDKKVKINSIFTSPGSGIGIKNVNHRLKTLYNRKLFFEKNNPKGLIVSMKIPVGIS